MTKLTPDQVKAIKLAQVQREVMRKNVTDHLSNAALARKFGVHIRTIEKVTQGYTHY